MEQRNQLRAGLATVADDSQVATGLSQIDSTLERMKVQFTGGDAEPIWGYLAWGTNLVDQAGVQFAGLAAQLRISATGQSY